MERRTLRPRAVATRAPGRVVEDDNIIPQSRLHSIDDAPMPTQPPVRRIFPLGGEDDDEILDDADDMWHSDDCQPYRKQFSLEYFPKGMGLRGGAKRTSRTGRRASEFGGVESLLKEAMDRRLSTRNQNSTSKRKRKSQDTVEINAIAYDKLMRSNASRKDKNNWKKLHRTKEGRLELKRIAMNKLIVDSSEDDSDTREPKRIKPSVTSTRRTRSSMRLRSKAASDHEQEYVQPDSESSDASSEEESQQSSADSDDEVIRRKRTSVAKKKQRSSVPLPKKGGKILERLNARQKRMLTEPDGKRNNKKGNSRGSSSTSSRKPANAKKNHVAGSRRSVRIRRKAKYKDFSASDDEGDSDDDFINDNEEIIESEGEIVAIDILEEEDEEDEEIEEPELQPDSEPESDMDDDYDHRPSARRTKKKRKKKNVRRKRTRPTSAFDNGQIELSARERRQRLDFLVQQSADIARHLHKAITDAANLNPAKENGSGAAASQVQKGNETSAENETKDAKDLPEGETKLPMRTEEEFVKPTGEGFGLKPHQIEGVKWLLTLDAQGLNAILADEMGLGKTIQTITFLASLSISGSRGPHLVLAPKNVCDHWAKEVRRWYPGEISVVTHHGNADERLRKMEEVLEEDNFDILVTSYEMAMRDILVRKRAEGAQSEHKRVLRELRSMEFEYLVVDEAHRLKSDLSKLNISIRNYGNAQRRLLLTGTPLSNDLKELWCLMNILNPRIFSSKATFETWFSAPFQSGGGAKAKLTHAEQSVIVDRLHTIIRPFFRRRVREDICAASVSADEIVVKCPMSEIQKALMLHYRNRLGSRDSVSANNLVMTMRMISSHPYSVTGALYDTQDKNFAKKIVASCGKFTFLHYSLPRLLAGGHRVLIFSQFRETLAFLEDLMEKLEIKCGVLHGATEPDERIQTISLFNAPDSDLQVFLLTTRAGGIGINLQTADTVILYDSDWNPCADLQAVSRIQRIGQKKTVHIMRLLTENSADEYIYEVQKHKLRTQALAVGAGKFNTSSGATINDAKRQKDLEALLQRMDVKKFMPGSYKGSAQDENVGDKTSNAIGDSQMSTYQNQWQKSLLRRGEEALPAVSMEQIWLNDADTANVPVWLKQDANLQAAAKAIETSEMLTAEHVYLETLQYINSVGAFSKKDRAARARRKDVNTYNESFSSEDDDGEEEDDNYEVPNAEIEGAEESSDDDNPSTPEKSANVSAAEENKTNAITGMLGVDKTGCRVVPDSRKQAYGTKVMYPKPIAPAVTQQPPAQPGTIANIRAIQPRAPQVASASQSGQPVPLLSTNRLPAHSGNVVKMNGVTYTKLVPPIVAALHNTGASSLPAQQASFLAYHKQVASNVGGNGMPDQATHKLKNNSKALPTGQPARKSPSQGPSSTSGDMSKLGSLVPISSGGPSENISEGAQQRNRIRQVPKQKEGQHTRTGANVGAEHSKAVCTPQASQATARTLNWTSQGNGATKAAFVKQVNKTATNTHRETDMWEGKAPVSAPITPQLVLPMNTGSIVQNPNQGLRAVPYLRTKSPPDHPLNGSLKNALPSDRRTAHCSGVPCTPLLQLPANQGVGGNGPTSTAANKKEGQSVTGGLKIDRSQAKLGQPVTSPKKQSGDKQTANPLVRQVVTQRKWKSAVAANGRKNASEAKQSFKKITKTKSADYVDAKVSMVSAGSLRNGELIGEKEKARKGKNAHVAEQVGESTSPTASRPIPDALDGSPLIQAAGRAKSAICSSEMTQQTAKGAKGPLKIRTLEQSRNSKGFQEPCNTPVLVRGVPRDAHLTVEGKEKPITLSCKPWKASDGTESGRVSMDTMRSPSTSVTDRAGSEEGQGCELSPNAVISHKGELGSLEKTGNLTRYGRSKSEMKQSRGKVVVKQQTAVDMSKASKHIRKRQVPRPTVREGKKPGKGFLSTRNKHAPQSTQPVQPVAIETIDLTGLSDSCNSDEEIQIVSEHKVKRASKTGEEQTVEKTSCRIAKVKMESGGERSRVQGNNGHVRKTLCQGKNLRRSERNNGRNDVCNGIEESNARKERKRSTDVSRNGEIKRSGEKASKGESSESGRRQRVPEGFIERLESLTKVSKRDLLVKCLLEANFNLPDAARAVLDRVGKKS